MQPHLLLDAGALAITEGGLRQIAALHALHAQDGKPLVNTYAVERRGTTAVIPVKGPLIHSQSIWALTYGLTSYETLLRDFYSALESGEISTIAFDFDSPGGAANGCGELSTAIYRARGRKRVEAYVGGQCCSAAFEIATACDHIWIDPAAMLGSVGVKTLLTDYSKMLADFGIAEHEIIAEQSPLKGIDPADAGDRARVKKWLTDMCSVFVSIVARNRGVPEKTVLSDFGQGDVLIGQAALDAGLADDFSDFETMLAGLAGEQENRSFAMGNAMNPASASASSGKCDGCGRAMDDDDDMYCRACHSEASALATAVGLEAKTPAAQLIARGAQLLQLERDLLSTTKTTTAAAALGAVAAGMAAVVDLAAVRSAGEAQAKVKLQADYRAALGDPRLSLGHLTVMVPTWLPKAKASDGGASEREKAEEAIAALTSQTREGLVAALCAAKATAETIESIQSFASLQGPPPAAHQEPAPAPSQQHQVVTASAADCAKHGITPQALEQFANVHSVADLKRPAQKGA